MFFPPIKSTRVNGDAGESRPSRLGTKYAGLGISRMNVGMFYIQFFGLSERRRWQKSYLSEGGRLPLGIIDFLRVRCRSCCCLCPRHCKLCWSWSGPDEENDDDRRIFYFPRLFILRSDGFWANKFDQLNGTFLPSSLSRFCRDGSYFKALISPSTVTLVGYYEHRHIK